MPGESEQGGGQSQGPATDRHNEPVVDPSLNVKDLNAAEAHRQDGLRIAETRHLRELLAMRSDCATEIRALESALADEKFAGVQREQALTESHRLELKGDSEKALTAALSAQKEAAAEQNKSNTLANDRLAAGLKELILNNYQISQAESRALGGKVEDLKAQVSILVNQRIGAGEQRQETRAVGTEQRSVSAGMIAMIALGSTILFGVISAAFTLLLR